MQHNQVSVRNKLIGYEIEVNIPKTESEDAIRLEALGPHPAYSNNIPQQDLALYYAAQRIEQLEQEIADLRCRVAA